MPAADAPRRPAVGVPLASAGAGVDGDLRRNHSGRPAGGADFATQTLTGDWGLRTPPFFSATQSDRATAASTDRRIAVGVTRTRLSGGRPDDTLGFAIDRDHAAGRQRATTAGTLDG